MAISDKLEELLDIKQDIKEAIENKGIDMTDVEFRGYAEKINEIETGGSSGVILDRIAIICFRITPIKRTTTSKTLTYDITSEMLSKTFFTDGEGNWYLPEDVSVYFNDTYKGKANTSLTLFSGTNQPTGSRIEFRVGTTPVALLLYYYYGSEDVNRTGINSEGYISIEWSAGSGSDEVYPNERYMEFIQLPDNFFDDFPEYSYPDVDYWYKENFLDVILYRGSSILVGWELIDYDL